MDLTKLKARVPIIVTITRNGAPTGVILTIVGVYSTYYLVKDTLGRQYHVYFAGSPNDVFTLANREDRIKYMKEKVEELEKELESSKKELSVLFEFESDEDYAADKIAKILDSGGNRKVISKILKELKETHYF